jgi:hypothetical protein
VSLKERPARGLRAAMASAAAEPSESAGGTRLQPPLGPCGTGGRLAGRDSEARHGGRLARGQGSRGEAQRPQA